MRFSKLAIACVFSIVLIVASVTPVSAKIVTLTAQNVKQLTSEKPTLVFLSLNCDLGQMASQTFLSAMADVDGVNLAVIDVNTAGSIIGTEKPYDILSIVLMKDGSTIATSKESGEDPWGDNNKRRWVYETLMKFKVPTRMPKPEDDRAEPLPDSNSTINLSDGFVALYQFDDLKDATGHQQDFRLNGEKLINQTFYSDGKYVQAMSGGSFSLQGSKPLGNGFSASVNFYLSKAVEPNNRRIIFTLGDRLMDVRVAGGKLFIAPESAGFKGGEYMSISNWTYVSDTFPIEEVKVTEEAWHNVIVTVNWETRRLSILYDGKRAKDIILTQRYVDQIKKYYDKNVGIQFYNFGWGAVLDGYADDVAFYRRPLSGKEMKAVYQKYGKTQNQEPEETVPTDDQIRLDQQLLLASYEGNATKVSQFLKQGANVDAVSSGWSSLMYAAYFGHVEVIKLLIKNHADASLELDGWNALAFAQDSKNPTAAKLLEDYSNTSRFFFERSIVRPKSRSIVIPPRVKMK